MKHILILSIILIAFIIKADAQKRFPVPVKITDTLLLKHSGQLYSIPNKNDTLWVLKNSQLQNAIIKAKKLDLAEEEIVELKKEIKNLKEQGQTKSDLVETVKKDRDYYKKNWNTCEKDFTTMANKSKRKGLYMKLALVAIPVAFVAGLFIL